MDGTVAVCAACVSAGVISFGDVISFGTVVGPAAAAVFVVRGGIRRTAAAAWITAWAAVREHIWWIVEVGVTTAW